MDERYLNQDHQDGQHSYVFVDFDIGQLSEGFIARHSSSSGIDADIPLTVQEIAVNEGLFLLQDLAAVSPVVQVAKLTDRLIISCSCLSPKTKLCAHQSQVLYQISRREELRVFFDEQLRHAKIRKVAADYGLEYEINPDDFFTVEYQNRKLSIVPKQKSILQVDRQSMNELQALLTPPPDAVIARKSTAPTDTARIAVLKQHKYYGHLQMEIYDAKISKEGKIKNPLLALNPLDLLWETDNPEVLKFYTAISGLQKNIDAKEDAPIDGLKAIARNPLELAFYYHDNSIAESINATSLIPVQIKRLKAEVNLSIEKKEPFYELSGTLQIGAQQYRLADLVIRFRYFILINSTLYLVDDPKTLAIISFFKKKANEILIHQSKYRKFKTNVLTKLEDSFEVNYKDVKAATPGQIAQQGFDAAIEKIIYLSDFGQFVMIIPVVRYGEAEISIRTKKQIYGVDDRDETFMVHRNDPEELKFTELLIKQHDNFREQLEDHLYYFYLHKKRFLDEDWFLNAFEEWQHNGIMILGFNELEGNKLNPNKVSISVHVQSGINWFNTKANVHYGRKKAALKQVYKAVRNKSKYVQLDDGTLGILPADWVEKFAGFFAAGEIIDDDTIQTPKINYLSISQLYEQEMLDEYVQLELDQYAKKLANFNSIGMVEVPAGFQGTLRHYQIEGLSWLNFLDDYNFGGCLADDMGLGKTIQIIAFILLQRAKSAHNTNLLVVPTSLIFNWQAEVARFAPSIELHTIYGADRIKNCDDFDDYELIITSYGTLLSDVNFLRHYEFNYIFLDESQNIKNPTSQRYKAARLLKSRNKIAITGTPIENNTFDLYGQLSFACPGLLGSRQYFKDIYSSPIDKFKVSKRARDLENKIRPFILRRTKKQVATELPEKTEMILYCEMKAEQRKVYDAYEKEFREYISATTSEELPRKSMHVLKGLTKLRQICNSPLLIDGVKVPGESSAKIEALMEEIENKASPHKVLIFSQFVSMLDLIKKELIARKIGHAYLTGSTRNREAVVKNFQENEDVKVFLISLKAGGTGLNLTEADYVYIVDPWWNPAVENQAIDRCYRIGQQKNVVAVRMICPDTIEEKIMKLQRIKKDLANQLIKADKPLLQSLSKGDLLDFLNK